MQYLSFRLSGVEYAVDVGIVETVVERGDIMPVPTPLGYLRGAMDLRGSVIPVIDLSCKFGIAEDSARPSGGVVVVFSVESGAAGSRRIGALVDEVSEVFSVDERTIESAKAEESSLWEGYVRGVIRVSGRMIVVIEPEGMFSVEELEDMKVVGHG